MAVFGLGGKDSEDPTSDREKVFGVQSARRNNTSSPDSGSAVEISLMAGVATCGSALLAEGTGSGIAEDMVRSSSAIRGDPKEFGTRIAAILLSKGKLKVGGTRKARAHEHALIKFTARVVSPVAVPEGRVPQGDFSRRKRVAWFANECAYF